MKRAITLDIAAFFKLSLLVILALLIIKPAQASEEKTPLLQRQDFKHFIKEMTQKHHFQQDHLIKLFKQVTIQNEVLTSIAKPYETKPWFIYREHLLTAERKKEGMAFWKLHEKTLKQAEKEYGIPASIIVAILGVETLYGKKQGNYRVIDALTTLAFYYPPRADFFKKELVAFLLLTREQGIKPLTVKGSYAGAIGQPQFMPSSYRHFAVNYAGHQRSDLRNNPIDVIGSIANYFKQNGWETGQPIVAPAKRRSAFFAKNPTIPPHKKPIFALEAVNHYGIKHHIDFPPHTAVGIIRLDDKYHEEYWIGFKNFYVITRYNTSELYAMAVFQLAQQLENARRQKPSDIS